MARLRAVRRFAALLVLASAPALGGDEPQLRPGQTLHPDYVAGTKAVEARDWEAAIRHFSRLTALPQYKAEAHNWLGYATRNQGRYALALEHYRQAVQANPRHRAAQQYLGETYLLLDRLGEAEEQRAVLRKLCPAMSCEELQHLRAQIAEYKRRRGIPDAGADR